MLPTIWNCTTDEVKTDVQRENLSYWLDIISPYEIADEQTYVYSTPELRELLMQFSIDSIGRRGKAFSDDDVNCLFAATPRDCIFVTEEEAEALPVIDSAIRSTTSKRKTIYYYKDDNDSYHELTRSMDFSDYNFIFKNGLYYQENNV
jgi:hypothetical protein